MAGRRKTFRIEKMTALHSELQNDEPHASRYGDIMRELDALRAVVSSVAAAPIDTSRQHEVQRLISELRLIHSAIGRTEELTNRNPATSPVARIAHELERVIGDSELATQKILTAAEDIDQAANNLSASLKGDFDNGMAQDIRERVIQIFEACNFQDLTSQRVAKVMATFAGLELQIARALDELMRINASPPLHGPSLAGDSGHVSQGDIDSMFDGDIRSD